MISRPADCNLLASEREVCRWNELAGMLTNRDGSEIRLALVAEC